MNLIEVRVAMARSEQTHRLVTEITQTVSGNAMS